MKLVWGQSHFFLERANQVIFAGKRKRSHILNTTRDFWITPAYGKPVLVMRNTTERPEGVKAGTLKLVGTKEEAIYEWFTKLLDDEEERSEERRVGKECAA